MNFYKKSAKIIQLTILCFVTLLTIDKTVSANELFNITYHRDSGTPTEQVVNFTLARPGELQIANANLIDDVVELAASTQIKVDGVSVLSPFSLPAGTTYSQTLEIGAHILTAILRGKAGGAVNISISEQSGMGYEILSDGTVKQRSTGLIWHRDPCTPGPVENDKSMDVKVSDENPYNSSLSANQYIVQFNNGNWGNDPDLGNANHSDWRIPNILELESLVDRRFANPAISNMDGNGIIFPYPFYGESNGLQYGQPFWMCPLQWAFGVCDPLQCPWVYASECDEIAGSNSKYRANVQHKYISSIEMNSFHGGGEWTHHWSVDFYWGTSEMADYGCVWPVRGPE